MGHPHIKPLTSLRGIAAIYVFIHHLLANLLPVLGNKVSSSTQLILNGYLWVDFFFILSGFLLAILYQQRFSEQTMTVRSFLIRRLARIYPLHLAVLFLFIIYQLMQLFWGNGPAFTGQYTLIDLLRNIFLLQAMQLHHTFTPWNSPSWSISAEWCAYLLFPVLVTMLYKIRNLGGLLSFWTISFASLFLIEAQTRHQLDLTGYLGVARCVLEFSMGIVLSNGMYNSRFCQKWLVNSTAQLACCLALLVTLHMDGLDVLSIMFMVFIIASISSGNSRFTRTLSHSWLVYLGKISYSIYMVHWLILISVKLVGKQFFDVNIKHIDSLSSITFISLTCFILVLIASVISYHIVEEPLRKWLPNKFDPTG